MFILKAVWTFFWFATAMNLAIQYTVTCTTMEDLDLQCSDREGHRAQLGAVFFSWVCLLLWIITTYWAYKEVADGAGRHGGVDDSYQQHHDEGDTAGHHQEPQPTTAPEREQPMISNDALPTGDTAGAVDVTHQDEGDHHSTQV